MKVTALLIALCVSLASAGVVITPVFDDQVVPKKGDDCALGVTTPSGCASTAQVAESNLTPAGCGNEGGRGGDCTSFSLHLEGRIDERVEADND
ncbi:hypothetical protein VPNG_04609 [Cytospora leucostoma]|uniref:Uncharacterized protein n=1 Tax=Cytospora leucostoma TaxID=1230097 RepID=A0A423XCH4_9PEZI|nr:hypothetical protein VPNG_04609 [Cytospora leucostoma]